MVDVISALLQSKLGVDVFVKQDPGYGIPEVSTGIPLVMKLKQAIYGLRTASRVWHLTLDKALKSIEEARLHLYQKWPIFLQLQDGRGGVLH